MNHFPRRLQLTLIAVKDSFGSVAAAPFLLLFCCGATTRETRFANEPSFRNIPLAPLMGLKRTVEPGNEEIVIRKCGVMTVSVTLKTLW